MNISRGVTYDVCHKGIIRIGRSHKEANGGQDTGEVVRRSPSARGRQLQDVETDPPGRVNVRVVYLRQEADFRWMEGVPGNHKDYLVMS